MRVTLLVAVTLLLGASAMVVYLYYDGRQLPPPYLTARVERGRIATTVNAIGTLNAVITVQASRLPAPFKSCLSTIILRSRRARSSPRSIPPPSKRA